MGLHYVDAQGIVSLIGDKKSELGYFKSMKLKDGSNQESYVSIR